MYLRIFILKVNHVVGYLKLGVPQSTIKKNKMLPANEMSQNSGRNASTAFRLVRGSLDGMSRLCSDSYEAPSTGRLDRVLTCTRRARQGISTIGKSPTRTTPGRTARPTLFTKLWNKSQSIQCNHLLHPTITATSVTDMEAVPVSNLTFCYPSRDGRWKPVTVRTIPCTVLPPITLEGGYDKDCIPRSRGFGLIHPSSAHPRPSIDLPSVSREKRPTWHRARGLFTISSSTSPWCPGMAGHSRDTSLQPPPQGSIKLHFKGTPASLPPLTL
jgi:hypothetical protein